MKKKQVIPQALKALRMKPHRKYCVLGNLATKVGWKCQDLVKKLEAKRRVKSGTFLKKKVALQKAKASGKKAAKLSKDEQALIAKYTC